MPGMVPPPHSMVEGTDDGDYYRGEVTGATEAQKAEVAAREAAHAQAAEDASGTEEQ
jgi:NADH-quinone oxidoreductase subunit I